MPHQFFGSRSKSKGKCPEGKTRDRVTKRCREKYQTGILPRTPCSPGKVRDTETKRCRERMNKARTPCSPGKVRDTETKRCRERLNKARTPCSPGKTRDASTGRCREKYQTGILPRTPCSPGKVRDTETKRCRSPRKPGPRKHSASRSSQRSRGTPSSYYEGAYDNMFAGDYGSPIDYGSY
jgi:hypothetical protein